VTYTESQPYKALIKTCIRHKQLPVSHRSRKPFAYISRSNYSIKQSIIFFEVGIVQILIVRSPLLLSPKGNRSAVDFYFSAEWHRKSLEVTSLTTSTRRANTWYLTNRQQDVTILAESLFSVQLMLGLSAREV